MFNPAYIEKFSLKKEKAQSLNRTLLSILDNSSDIVFLYDIENDCCVYHNQTAVELLGFTSEEFFNNPMTYYYTHYLRDSEIRTELLPLLRNETNRIEQESFYRQKAHILIPVHIKYSRVELSGHSLILIVAKDIRAEKMYREVTITTREMVKKQVKNKTIRLEDQLAKIQVIMDHVPFSIWLKDLEGNYLYANKSFEEECDLSLNEIIGKKDIEIWPTETGHQLHLNDQEVIQKGDPTKTEEAIIIKDNLSWMDLYRIPLKNSEGNIEALLSIRIDVTDRKTYENDALVAKELAESSNQLKSEFLAVMSHEIRTPLNGVTGFLHLLSETELDARQQKYINRMEISAQNLLSVINDVLDFSKIEAGRVELQKYKFNLHQLIKQTVSVYGSNTTVKNLDINTLIYSDVPEYIIGDEHRFNQVLNNLMGNAIKFTGKGEVFLEVQVSKMLKDRVELLFSVTDTGIGIDPDSIEKILQPFIQEDSSPTRQYGGTGLGLAISDRIIRLMNGQMNIESEPGEGTTVRFTVQFDRVKKIDYKIREFPDLKALIIDKKDRNASILGYYLHCLSVKAHRVKTFGEGLSYLREHTDTDVNFFGSLDGIDQVEDLVSLHRENEFSIVSVTSLSSDEKEEELNNFEYDSHLLAPYSIKDVIEVIEKCQSVKSREKKASLQGLHRKEAEPANLSEFRILVADDDEMGIELIKDILSALKVNFDSVSNGIEAVEAFRRQHYDLILMDCEMPVMSGFTATEEIRKLEKGEQHTPIVAFTAHAFSEHIERCHQSGMDDYISKPANINKLRELIYHYSCMGQSSSKCSDKSKIKSL
jgi:PAS domain S-box-containing protein